MWISTDLKTKWIVLLAALLAAGGAIATDKEREKSAAPTARTQMEEPVEAGKRQKGSIPKERQKSAGSTSREKSGVSSSRVRSAK
jgi:hypothetical protein